MALVEDTGGEDLQELDRRLSRTAQVCCSAAAAAADTVIILLVPATAFYCNSLLCLPTICNRFTLCTSKLCSRSDTLQRSVPQQM